MWQWCNERLTYSCGNFTTTDDRICSNVTFWSQVNGGECRTAYGAEGERCRGTYSGQCIYPTTSDYQLSRTCQDLSDQVHKVNMTCPSGDSTTSDDYCESSCRRFGNDSTLCTNCPSAADPHNCTGSCATPGAGCRSCTNPDYFLCPKSGQCVHPDLRCDLHPQCDQAEDEEGCIEMYKVGLIEDS